MWNWKQERTSGFSVVSWCSETDTETHQQQWCLYKHSRLNSKNVHMYTSHTKEERNKQVSEIQDNDLMIDIEEEAGSNIEMNEDGDDGLAASSITLEWII